MPSEHVIVAVRARPFNSREKRMGCKLCLEMQDGVSTLIKAKAEDGGKETRFTYDRSYWIDTKQETMFDDLGKAVVQKGVEGYNGTIFAYGQTGSGKTYSMMGEEGNLGLIPRLNIDLFQQLNALKTEKRQYFVTVSYLEIYNEVIKDLLNPSDAHLQIREHPDLGIYVDGLAEIKATSSNDIQAFIDQGNKVRTVAATKMNERSSRSHSCFTIRISQKTTEELKGGITRESKLDSRLNLVDLAGSERAGKTGAAGQQLKEAGAINLSLSALGNVINALAKAGGAKGHIPYRDSKLTRLLQDSLGGNARTIMIAALSPADDNYDETLSTLQYASRAKQITNKATKNEDVNEKVIHELKNEIEELKAQLAAIAEKSPSRGTSGRRRRMPSHGSFRLDPALQQKYLKKISILERAQQESWEEKERLSAQFKKEREKNLDNENHIRSVMETVKGENIELMKRTQALRKEHAMLTQDMNSKIDERGELKYEVADLLKKLKELRKLEASGAKQDSEIIQNLIVTIEIGRKKLVASKSEIEEIQKLIEENEERMLEEKAEMAAHRLILQEDKNLRKAIAEEEKQKFLKEKEKYLEDVLLQEKEKLTKNAEAEIGRIKALYSAQPGQNERATFEISAVRASSDYAALEAEVKTLKEKHQHNIDALELHYKEQLREKDEETANMVKLVVEGFEAEILKLKIQNRTCATMLTQAVNDLEFLHKQRQSAGKEEIIIRE